ncbi:MAG TPA: HD domain-containing phosphohydrolase [Acidimicrobiia bacterium]|nr:HD domain-containing phosphohydrolase [Acidimicrobiia bacterium]
MTLGGGATSATGGSATTQAVDADPRRWRSRRGIAFAIRAAVFLVPFAASFVAARVVRGLLPVPHGLAATVAWWVTVVLTSMLAFVAIDRTARKLLPIAALYKLALSFPDQAPSRYKLALRSGGVKELSARVRAGGDIGATAGEAAENVLMIVNALTKHDRMTRGHSERVRAYAELIGEELGLDRDDRDKLRWAALVHDVGKLCVRPEVLNKPGRPTEEEWAELRAHPAEAERLVAPLRPWLGDWVDAATQHHERIDGKGYPYGLSGDEISLAGRIVAVADAYDCMTSTRSYKKALPTEQARFELTRNSGTQFDPVCVRALLNVSVGRRRGFAGIFGSLTGMPGVREMAAAVSGGSATAGATAAAVVALAVPVTGAPMMFDPVEPAAAEEIVLVDTRSDSGPSSAPGDPSGSDDPAAPTDARPGTTTSTTTDGGSASTSTTTAPTSTTTRPRLDDIVRDVVDPLPIDITPTTTTTTTTANREPDARDDEVTVLVGTTTAINVLANDTDEDGVLDRSSLKIVTAPSSGKATVMNGRIVFTAPLLALIERVELYYQICDDDGACEQARLRIFIL